MVNPIILLLGGALLVAGKKRKRSSKSSSSNGGEPPVSPGEGWPSGPSSAGLTGPMNIAAAPSRGKVWEQCEASQGSAVGTYAAFGPQGECVVFWNPQTWVLMAEFLDAEFFKLSNKQKKKICKPDDCIPNPDAPSMESELFCEWKPNPDREKFVANLVKSAFPQLKDYDFPADQGAPFFPRMVWAFTNNLFASQICGFGRIT